MENKHLDLLLLSSSQIKKIHQILKATLRQNGEMDGMQGERWNWKRYPCVLKTVMNMVMMMTKESGKKDDNY